MFERKECRSPLKRDKSKGWVSITQSILTEEIFISSLFYTIYVDSKLVTKKMDHLSMILTG